MTEKTTTPTARRRVTRRGVLSLVGTGFLAGCSGLPGVSDDDEPTIRAYELLDIDPDEHPDPAVVESVPVDVAPDHFHVTQNRVTTLLKRLPTPLGPENVPNGHVRTRLSDAADAATDELDEARTAQTEFMALQSLQRARGRARYAAAGWAVAERGISIESIQREYERTSSEARSVRNGYEYVGSDPVPAMLVHARIENLLARVVDDGDPTYQESHLLNVAQWGETAESAQANLEDARHLSERFTTSLPDDASTVEKQLLAAAKTVLSTVRSRESTLPPEPTADDRGISVRVIDDLRWEAEDGVTRIGDANGPASALIDANERLTQFRALEQLQKRIDEGAVSRPQTVEDVRNIRTKAYEILRAALEQSPEPELTRTAVTSAALRVAGADWELAQYEGEIAVSRLDDVIADYIIAIAMGRAATVVTNQVLEIIENA